MILTSFVGGACRRLLVLAGALSLATLSPFPAGPFAPSSAHAIGKAADLVEDGQLINLQSDRYRALFQELENKYDYKHAELDRLFAGVKIGKRVLELMDKPWEAQPYYKYSKLFITPSNIAAGKEKLKEHAELLGKIEEQLGVDREIVVAIWAIETRFGANQGSFDVFSTLNTLFDAYPRRSPFFREQLIHFLLLCRENDVDPHSVKGSYAGAFGQTQFIPSSFREYAVSFDGDERRDVWNSVPDILASIANYLRRHHWTLDGPIYADLGNELNDIQLIDAQAKGRSGRVSLDTVKKTQRADVPATVNKDNQVAIIGLELPPEAGAKMRYVAGYQNFVAITRWNNSNRYAMAVIELAEAFLKNNKK